MYVAFISRSGCTINECTYCIYYHVNILMIPISPLAPRLQAGCSLVHHTARGTYIRLQCVALHPAVLAAKETRHFPTSLVQLHLQVFACTISEVFRALHVSLVDIFLEPLGEG